MSRPPSRSSYTAHVATEQRDPANTSMKWNRFKPRPPPDHELSQMYFPHVKDLAHHTIVDFFKDLAMRASE
jgi:hypothetical protein